MAKTEVRERIAEAAWRLFDEKGYENVSVDEIIAATGTSIVPVGVLAVSMMAAGCALTWRKRRES